MPNSFMHHVTINGTNFEIEDKQSREDLIDLKSDLNSSFWNNQDGKLPYSIVNNQYVKLDDGSFANYSGWARTDYIPVRDIYSITIKSTVQSYYNAFYNEDKSFNRAFTVETTEAEIIIPPSVKYIALSNTAAGMATLDVTFKTTESIKITSLEKCTDELTIGDMPFRVIQNSYVNKADGEFKYQSKWGRTGFIYVGNAEKLTIVSTASSQHNAFYNSDFQFVRSFTLSVGSNDIYVPNTAKYIALSNELTRILELDIKVSKKRIDEIGFEYVHGEYITSNGAFAEYTNWTRTELIPIHQYAGMRVKSSLQSSHNAFYKKDKTFHSRFTVETTETCIAIPEDAYYVAFSNADGGMIRLDVAFDKSNIYSYPDHPRTIYSYDNNLIYSVDDGVISITGSITGTTFRLDLPNIILDGYNIINVEVLNGSYTGNLYLLLLPTIKSAYINLVKGHIARLDHFTNETRGIAVYIPGTATFNDFKFRIWITPGLINKPYNKSIVDVIGCNAGEYNAADYSRIGDGIVYNVFGNALAVCKDGMIGKNIENADVKFGLLADLHYIDNENFYKRIYGKLSNEYHVDFCMMLGDVIDSGYYYQPDLCASQLAQLKNSLQYLLCPNFPFCGNHDDDVSAFAHHGVVDYGNIRFVYFWADYDSTSEGGLVKASELTWLEQQLASSTARINIIMCHYAVSTTSGFNWYIADADQRQAIADLADEYGVLLYLNGHEHDHSISVGTVGDMTDINLPNGKYAYCVCEIDNSGEFTLTAYDSTTDEVLKTITVSLLS